MYIRGLDGLRAIAVLLVFLTHKTAWGADSRIAYSGVWLFLLLSGFLITGQLEAGRRNIEAGRSGVTRELCLFWIKRSLRIFPAYYLLIAILVPLYLVAARPISGAAWYIAYVSNIYFQCVPSEFLTTWAHFWTLAVEQQFYVAFAPVILLIPSRHATSACLVLVATSLVERAALVGFGVSPTSIYIDSLVNFGILAFGGALALNRGRVTAALRQAGLTDGLTGWFALYCVVVSVPLAEWFVGDNDALLQACFVLTVSMAAMLLMIVVASQTGVLLRLLEGRVLSYCGRVSYGLYLYNDYIKNDLPERLLRAVTPHLWPNDPPRWVALGLTGGTPEAQALDVLGLVTCFLALLAVASASWFVVERPVLRLKRSLGRRPMLGERRQPWPALDGSLRVADRPSGPLG